MNVGGLGISEPRLPLPASGGPATSSDPRRLTAERANPESAPGGSSVRWSGAAGLGPRPRGRRGRRGGGYCTFPPGPARSVPTRATERACAASCRAASTPDPAAAASSATEPVVTQAQNTALKGGGSGGGGCAPALPVPRAPPSDQPRLGGAKKGAAPC